MGTFRMPSLGADMESGRLLEWTVQPGDLVHKGDIIAVVDTAKSAIEVEVFEDGRVAELLVEPGNEVPVGTPLAVIESADAAPRAAGSEPEAPAPTRLSRIATPPVRHLAHQLGIDIARIPGSGKGGRITRTEVLAASGQRPRITPRARRLAQQEGVEFSEIADGAAGGPVTSEAVERALAREPAVDAAAQVAPRTGSGTPRADTPDRTASMRQATATLMGRSAREIPHYYTSSTVDVTALKSWLQRHNADLPVRRRVLPIAALLRATVIAATAVPQLNGHWVDGGFRPGGAVHLGVATATRGGGLVTPAIVDAQELRLDDLMTRLADLVKRAKAGTLRSREIAAGTLTVTSLADGGPDALFGVIYPPQVALVGFGGIHEQPWAVDGMLTVRQAMTVTLAADHRATDGRTGAAFLTALTTALTRPEEL